MKSVLNPREVNQSVPRALVRVLELEYPRSDRGHGPNRQSSRSAFLHLPQRNPKVLPDRLRPASQHVKGIALPRDGRAAYFGGRGRTKYSKYAMLFGFLLGFRVGVGNRTASSPPGRGTSVSVGLTRAENWLV